MADTEDRSEEGGSVDTQGAGGVPRELRYIAIGVGLLLLVAGVVAMAVANRLFTAGALFLCVGFGITLAVFGANARGAFMNLNVVGGGALAVALYLLIYNYPMPLAEAYVRGRIENSAAMEGVAGTARQLFLVGRPKRNDDFSFVVFEREIESPYIKFLFQPDSEQGGGEFYISCIETGVVRAAMEKGEEVVFSLERDQDGGFRLIDNSTARSVGALNRLSCEDEGPAAPAGISPIGWADVFGMTAQAATPADFERLLRTLESDDAVARESARVALSDLTDEASITEIARSWEIARSSQRADLGRLVVWSNLIARERRLAVTIAESLTLDQLRYLGQLTGQGDYTLRQYSTELFHRLLETTSWPAGPSDARAADFVTVVRAVFEARPVVTGKADVSYSADTNVYNMVVALWFAECNLGRTVRSGVVSALRDLDRRIDARSAPRTQQKIDEVLARLRGC